MNLLEQNPIVPEKDDFEKINYELKKQILELLSKALEEKNNNNFEKAMNILGTDISKLKKKITRERQVFSIPLPKPLKESSETTFLGKYGRILYQIGELTQAYDIYEKLKAISSDESLYYIYKVQGDCLRRMKKYEDSIQCYEESFKALESYGKVCGEAADIFKAPISNNCGLTYFAMKNFKKAQSSFETAIKCDFSNPLFHCNLANALYAQGNKKESFDCFKQTAVIFKSMETDSKEGKGVTKANKETISEMLVKFLKEIEQIEKIQLSKQDKIVESREINYVDNFVNNFDNVLAVSNEEIEAQKIKETKLKIKKIEKIEQLYEFYDGFIFTLQQGYDTSKVVNTGLISLDTSNLGLDVAVKLVSFIPLIGDKVSTVVQGAWDFGCDAMAKKAAANICKMGVANVFDEIIQDLAVDIIMKNEKVIMKSDPEKAILPKWQARFKALLSKIHSFQVSLYGERMETPMQKFGYKIANDLLEKFIASGKIYGNQIAIRMKKAEKLEKLIVFSGDLLQGEILGKGLAIEEQEEKKENENENTASGKKSPPMTRNSSCCSIF